jgi:hypothetical protein
MSQPQASKERREGPPAERVGRIIYIRDGRCVRPARPRRRKERDLPRPARIEFNGAEEAP